MLHGHPYAPVLLGLTQMFNDPDMRPALESEGLDSKILAQVILGLEAICDVSYQDARSAVHRTEG